MSCFPGVSSKWTWYISSLEIILVYGQKSVAQLVPATDEDIVLVVDVEHDPKQTLHNLLLTGMVKSRPNMVNKLNTLLCFNYEEMPLSIRACLLDKPSSNFAKSLMLGACLVCITCSSAPDVSNFWLTGDSLCGHPACSLRQWGCSGEGAPAPVNYQLINSGSFLLVLVSACKRLLVCAIGGRHCDYGIRKKKYRHIFFPWV